MKCKILLILVAFLLSAGIVQAQTRTISGVVLSADDNEPLVGATVHVQGTNQAVSTNLDGRFTIQNVSDKAKHIEVSYVGMVAKQEPISPQMTVVLSSAAQTLDEVVVTAYGTSKKSSLTGAIAAVKNDKIELRPTTSAVAALEGNVAGLQVSSVSGQPGSTPAVQIRGVGTVNGTSEPLYVVDGVPMDADMADINPADIESISVLKDAASCALYGSRAANGVILVTTKGGNGGGKASVDLRIKQGWYTRGIPEYRTTNPYQFMRASWMNMMNAEMSTNGASREDAAAYATENLIPEMLKMNIFNVDNQAIFNPDGTIASGVAINPLYADDLDWFDQGSRTGYRQEYTASGTMQTEKANAFFSLGYLSEDGYTRDAKFERLTGRANVNVQPTKWLRMGLNLNASHQNSTFTPDEDGMYVSLFTMARDMAPIYPVHLHDPETGEYVLDPVTGNKVYDTGEYRNQAANRNVIWEGRLNSNKQIRNTMQGIAFAEVKFLRDFTFTFKGNLSIRHSDRNKFDNPTVGDGVGAGGRFYAYHYRYKSYSYHETLNWRHTFNNVHYFDVLLGHENYHWNRAYERSHKDAQIREGGDYLSNFTAVSDINGYRDNYRTESWLGRLRYSFRDTYNFEGSFRRDGTSRFKQKWGNFGSVGVNWVITNEEFCKDLPWLQNTVLRADWGRVGSDDAAGLYDYMSLYDATYVNGGQGAFFLNNLANPDLKWETAESWGIGIDTRLFNRWNLNIEYFDKRNKDLLFWVRNPMSAGTTDITATASSRLENIGTISNRGVEINTDVDIFTNRDWIINFQANATFIKNKVTKMPEQNKDGLITSTFKIKEGKDRYAFWMRDWQGVDQMTGRSVYQPNVDEYYYMVDDGSEEGMLVGNPEGSDMTDEVYEINGKYYTNNSTYARYVYKGTALPKVTGSFGLRVSWKNITLSTLFTYSLGGKMYDYVYAGLMTPASSVSNFHSDILGAWNGIPEGMTETSANRIDPNGVSVIDYNTAPEDNSVSTRWLVSRDYLCMKNLTLHYAFPKKWLRPIGVKDVEIYGTIDNVFTTTARRGVSPQMNFSGLQESRMVIPRVYTLGLNVKF